MQNHSSNTSALERHAHSGSCKKGYFNNFSLIFEFITSNRAIYTARHYTSDACCLRKLMLHSGNHMGSWRAARRPAEHDPTFMKTFPVQENCLHELQQPRSRNKGNLCVVVAYKHQISQRQMYANMINEEAAQPWPLRGRYPHGHRTPRWLGEQRRLKRPPCISAFLLYGSLFQLLLSPRTKYILQALWGRAFILLVL